MEKTEATPERKSVNKRHQSRKMSLFITIACGLITVLVITLICGAIVGSNEQYVLPAQSTKHAHVGIVLGAGVAPNGKPYDVLKARLDVAADALNKGQVDKLILSGDNRYEHYNEPQAMMNYLEQTRHIAASKLQPDYAGRSTYQSCERAAKVFGLTETIIYSTGSHLPRAIYLCRHFGIETYGVSSDLEANNSGRREPIARVKAVLNVYVGGESSVLGPPIKL